ncbi:MAG: tripartite tricarboxylate transporter substrate binding protein [Betaproteobacteria bacterium]|nr:tripartite tricarboxylate transporter substrate binding protein [Betaproteobacteria bacterium]
MNRSSRVLFLAAILLFIVPGTAALAQRAGQGFPERPLRYIVPFPPGGSTDIVARIVAAGLSESLGQSVVIDNRGGAGSTVVAEIASHAAPDGYTIFACNVASQAVAPALYRKLGYDPVASFAPIGLIGSTAGAIVVHPAVAAKTLEQFIALAKASPGKVKYASPGVGSSPQLMMEMFRAAVAIDLLHVPYKGAGPALADLMGGHVEAMVSTVPSFIAAYRGGKIRMLAVSSTTRHPDLPEVPTIAESGVPGFEVISWQGLCTPAGVAAARLERIHDALVKVLAQAEIQKQLAAQGMQPMQLSGDKFAKAVRDAGIKQQ